MTKILGLLVASVIMITGTLNAEESPSIYIGRATGLHAPSIITTPYQLGFFFGEGNMLWYEQGENGITDPLVDGGVTINSMSYKNQGLGYRSYTDHSLWFLNLNLFGTYNKYTFEMDGSARVDDSSNTDYGKSIQSSLVNTTTVGCLGFGSSWKYSFLQLGVDWYGYCQSNSIKNESTNSVNNESINTDLNDFGSGVVSEINEWNKLIIVYFGIVF